MEKMYNSEELGAFLKLNKQTVLRFIREGKIKSVKVGRNYLVKESALQEYLDQNALVFVESTEQTGLSTEEEKNFVDTQKVEGV